MPLSGLHKPLSILVLSRCYSPGYSEPGARSFVNPYRFLSLSNPPPPRPALSLSLSLDIDKPSIIRRSIGMRNADPTILNARRATLPPPPTEHVRYFRAHTRRAARSVNLGGGEREREGGGGESRDRARFFRETRGTLIRARFSSVAREKHNRKRNARNGGVVTR